MSEASRSFPSFATAQLSILLEYDIQPVVIEADLYISLRLVHPGLSDSILHSFGWYHMDTTTNSKSGAKGCLFGAARGDDCTVICNHIHEWRECNVPVSWGLYSELREAMFELQFANFQLDTQAVKP